MNQKPLIETTIAQPYSKNASLFHLLPNKKCTLCLSMYGILMSNVLLVSGTNTVKNTRLIREAVC
jgi:hypothetical protein